MNNCVFKKDFISNSCLKAAAKVMQFLIIFYFCYLNHYGYVFSNLMSFFTTSKAFAPKRFPYNL